MPRVLCVAFEAAQTLDVTGPAEVFASVGRVMGCRAYQVLALSVGGGSRTTSSGIRIETRELVGVRPRASDIVVVAGGGDAAVRGALKSTPLLSWIERSAKVVRLMTSVCSGAFLLAAAGILDGKRATTHWSACDRLAKAFPQVVVDDNAIFVEDGPVWTSAGVTTGIDMALAIVERDHGRTVADTVAARLVLYVRRPGFQSQFSEALVSQRSSSDPLGPALSWARAHLRQANTEALARSAGLSLRTLHRRCLELTRTTPARLIEKLRVEHARTLLETTELPLKGLAVDCGFGNPVRMKRAFERELGMGPREYRLLHAPDGASYEPPRQ